MHPVVNLVVSQWVYELVLNNSLNLEALFPRRQNSYFLKANFCFKNKETTWWFWSCGIDVLYTADNCVFTQSLSCSFKKIIISCGFLIEWTVLNLHQLAAKCGGVWALPCIGSCSGAACLGMNRTQSRIPSCIVLTTSKCEHVHSPPLEESKKNSHSEHFSSLLSFQEHYLQSWYCFSQMIWFQAMLLLSTSTAGQCPWKMCYLQSFVLALWRSWH